MNPDLNECGAVGSRERVGKWQPLIEFCFRRADGRDVTTLIELSVQELLVFAVKLHIQADAASGFVEDLSFEFVALTGCEGNKRRTDVRAALVFVVRNLQ